MVLYNKTIKVHKNGYISLVCSVDFLVLVEVVGTYMRDGW